MASPLVIVNGPIARAIGMNGGANIAARTTGSVSGFATSHDHVDGQDLASQRTPARCDFALDKVRIAAKGLHDGVNFVLCGWDDR